MAQLKFDEDQRTSVRTTPTSRSIFARKLIAWGIVKNESRATLILLVLIAIGCGVIVYNLVSLQDTPTPPPLSSQN